MTARILFVHAISPLHVGTGQSVGAVDLPIARGRATEHPYVPGSGIKGPLRDLARDKLGAGDVVAVFGPETDKAHEHAGAVAIGDANLLLLPIRSVAGTFSWVTSPLLLARFARDCKEAGIDTPSIPNIMMVELCGVTTASQLTVNAQGQQKGPRVIFEDLDLQPDTHAACDELASFLADQLFPGDPTWARMLKARLCVVHDDVMTFLARHGTDVVTRIKLDDDTKTVAKGQLWTEENLPVETVLVSLVVAMPNKHTGLNSKQIFDKLGTLSDGMIQLGGKATAGRGRCRLVLTGGVQ